jgi:hypothetical protein
VARALGAKHEGARFRNSQASTTDTPFEGVASRKLAWRSAHLPVRLAQPARPGARDGAYRRWAGSVAALLGVCVCLYQEPLQQHVECPE